MRKACQNAVRCSRKRKSFKNQSPCIPRMRHPLASYTCSKGTYRQYLPTTGRFCRYQEPLLGRGRVTPHRCYGQQGRLDSQKNRRRLLNHKRRRWVVANVAPGVAQHCAPASYCFSQPEASIRGAQYSASALTFSRTNSGVDGAASNTILSMRSFTTGSARA